MISLKMKSNKTLFLWIIFVELLALTESYPGGCQSKQSTSPIMRYVGDSIQLLCSDSSPCQGTSYAFYHYNQHTGQFELIHLGTHKLTINVALKNAGEYSCVKECSWNVTNELKCYWNVIALPEVQWNLDETVMLNGSVNGSCTALGNPRPLPIIVISRLCEYQSKSITIDNYTTTVEFSIPHVTKDCQDIYCHASNYQSPNLRRLNIIENSMENSKVNASVEDGKPEEDANDKLVPEETMGNATNSKLENIFDSTSVDCDNCINNTQPDGSSSGAISTSTKLLVFTTYLSATTVGIAITLLFELL